MRLTVDRTPLLAAIGRVRGAAGNGKTIPILGFLLLEAERDTLRIRANDLTVEASCGVSATVDAGGAACVSADLLHDAVRSTPEGAEIGLELPGKLQRLKLVAGRSTFNLPTLPPEDFSRAPAPTVHQIAATLPARDLLRLIEKVAFAAGVNDDRHYLNGVCLHLRQAPDGPVLRAVATNGRLLAYCETPCPEGLARMPSVILSSRFVAELRRLLADVSGDLELGIDGERVNLQLTGARLSAPLIAGQYPDYGRVIPDDLPHEAQADAGVLRAAVRRALVVATADGADKLRAVRITFAPGEARVAAHSFDRGDADDLVELAYDGPEQVLGFNGPQLAELLAQVEGPRARLQFGGSNQPVLVCEPDDPRRLALTLSLKV